MEKVRKDALEANFLEVYDKFKFSFYRKVFSQVKEREGSLTAMEVFSLEVINQLGRPTIGKFAEFLNISQSNATYKVASLINKGYLRKERSGPDKREYYLVLSETYYGYIGMMRDYVSTVMERMRERFPAQELDRVAEMLAIMSRELMPEVDE